MKNMKNFKVTAETYLNHEYVTIRESPQVQPRRKVKIRFQLNGRRGTKIINFGGKAHRRYIKSQVLPIEDTPFYITENYTQLRKAYSVYNNLDENSVHFRTDEVRYSIDVKRGSFPVVGGVAFNLFQRILNDVRHRQNLTDDDNVWILIKRKANGHAYGVTLPGGFGSRNAGYKYTDALPLESSEDGTRSGYFRLSDINAQTIHNTIWNDWAKKYTSEWQTPNGRQLDYRDLEIIIKIVKAGSVGHGGRRFTITRNAEIYNKRSIIQIINSKFGDCGVRAFLIARAYHRYVNWNTTDLKLHLEKFGTKEWKNYTRRMRSERAIFQREVDEIYDSIGIARGTPLRFQDFEKLAELEGNCIIKIWKSFDRKTSETIDPPYITGEVLSDEEKEKGDEPKDESLFKVFHLFYHVPDGQQKGHYDTITNIGAFFATESTHCYECDKCGHFYSDERTGHKCIMKCLFCKSQECPFHIGLRGKAKVSFKQMKKLPTCTLCVECGFHYPNQECFKQHLNGFCQRKWRCPDCHYVYDKAHYGGKDEFNPALHQCYDKYCDCCRQIQPKGHMCYIQQTKVTCLEEDDDGFAKIIYFDFETMSSRKAPIHIVNFATAMYESSDRAFNFTTLNDFAEWLFNSKEKFCYKCKVIYDLSEKECRKCHQCHSECDLKCKEAKTLKIRKKHAGYTLIAHNGKGYDFQFIYKWCLEKGMKVNPICVGNKIILMNINKGKNTIRFIDSIAFIPSSLEKFVTTFGLEEEEFAKGYFPHKFNTPANQGYSGSMPKLEDYEFHRKSTKDKMKAETWYERECILYQPHTENAWDLQDKIRIYCESDVKLLRRGCQVFRNRWKFATDTDPFVNCTIASACNQYFRGEVMEEKSLAVYPDSRSVDTQSDLAFEWFSYIQQHLKISLKHARKGGEKKIWITDENGKRKKIKVDGFQKCTNGGKGVVFEFHGDYIHGNIKNPKFKPAGLNNKTASKKVKKTNQQLYDETNRKIAQIKAEGYEVNEMWEYDWNKLKKNNPAVREWCRQWLDSPTEVKPLHIRDSFFGGRTNASYLYFRPTASEDIRYVDICSLYPCVNRYDYYPVGHPEIIHCGNDPDNRLSLEYLNKFNFKFKKNQLVETANKEWSDMWFFGFVKCKMIPPKNLFHPVLPQRNSVRNLTEKGPRTKKTMFHLKTILGTWTTCEFKLALAMGYKCVKIYEVYHFKEKSNMLFRKYIDTFLKLKLESSEIKLKNGETKDEYKRKYIDDCRRLYGFELDYDRIKHNPGLYKVAKLALNGFWGKFGQRSNQIHTKPVYDPDEFLKIVSDPKLDICIVNYLNPQRTKAEVKYRKVMKENKYDTSYNTSTTIASFTTSRARMRLYEKLHILGKQVLYYDTDSCIYVYDKNNAKHCEVEIGKFLGEWTNEIKYYWRIREFVSTSPKEYAYRCFNMKNPVQMKDVVKAKGHSLNHENANRLNFDEMKKLLLNKGEIKLKYLNFKLNSDKSIQTKSEEQSEKLFNANKYDKRVIGENAYDEVGELKSIITYPHGF